MTKAPPRIGSGADFSPCTFELLPSSEFFDLVTSLFPHRGHLLSRRLLRVGVVFGPSSVGSALDWRTGTAFVQAHGSPCAGPIPAQIGHLFVPSPLWLPAGIQGENRATLERLRL